MKNKIYGIAIAMIALSANSFAQSTKEASTTATLVTPISIAKDFDMNFGQLAASGTAGTVILDYANAVTKSGGVKLLAATDVKTAQFTVTGDGTLGFSISIPTSVTLASGANNLTVDGITCDAGSSSALVAGSKVLKVKATLQVPANAPAGTYANTSDLAVTVNYN